MAQITTVLTARRMLPLMATVDQCTASITQIGAMQVCRVETVISIPYHQVT